MKQVIVTTTINAPTEAVRRFDAMADWTLVVIGDRKTPPDYRLDRGIYVSPEEQEQYDKPLSDAIGWNCIQRRSFGLLWAHDMGAEVVAVVDDDNIPREGWGDNLMLGRETEVDVYDTDLPVFDPLGATNHPELWHRGYPLTLVARRRYSAPRRETLVPDVQADLWDGDPDVDAVCRMIFAPECRFDPALFPMAGSCMGPFNSQNTFLKGELLRDYFLFPHVGRMDDIWTSYYVQARGARVVYGKPSVYQARNPHNLVKDMQAEYIGYEHNEELVQRVAEDPDALLAYLPEASTEAFRCYRRHFDA